MRLKYLKVIFTLTITLSLAPLKLAYADVLKPEAIIKSSARFYPDILASYQSIKATRTYVDAARGKFDTNITQEAYARPDGFYDGTYLKSEIEQPIPEFNSKIYTGYRLADGIFPIYENELETDNRGEYYIGVKLSLLRDRLVDKNRTAISVAELNVLERETQLILEKLTIQRNALQKYWSWLTAGHQYFVYQDLLELAQIRQKNLTRQVELGQLAAIYLQENQQYLLKRKAEVNIAQANLKMLAQELSLYYRDLNGNPKAPSLAMLPKKMPKLSQYIAVNNVFNNLLEHPAFKILDTQKKILLQKKALAENDLLPYIDLGVKASSDFGGGTKQYNEGELTVNLNFKVPLQRTIAKSKKSYAEAKLQELIYKEKIQFDKLRMALNKLLINMDNQQQFLKITKQEVLLAKKMSQVEEKRFEAGISDFFTLNKREEDMMKVRLQRLKAQENYLKMQEEMKLLTANLATPFEVAYD
ncbi:MAG: outer membrane protein TolC [Alphaproteobacteria bacterium]|jgi:outer membrane protein TolC